MPRKKSSPIFISYTSVDRPDNAAFAELVKKAIGPDRTVSEFAEICGVSPSTISRIVKNQFKTPSSDVVIKAIADNADPASGVDSDILLKASGRAPIQLDESMQMVQRISPRTKEPLFEAIGRETIVNAMIDRQYKIKVTRGENIITFPGLRYMADFTVDFDAGEDVGFDKWSFDIVWGAGSIHSVMHKLSWIFGAAYLESTRERRIKVSLLLTDRDAFEAVQFIFAERRIRDLVSVILIDYKNQLVLDEFQIPTEDSTEYKSLLTSDTHSDKGDNQ